VTRRSGLLTLAVLLVIVLVGGRWLALETAERAWAATFPGGTVLTEARTLARLMQVFVLLFALTWATGNVFIVYRTIGSVQMPRRLGDLEIVEAVPQPVLFALTLGTGIVGGLLLSFGTGDWWRAALLASAPPHFGVTDEILRHDLGYYVAVLPWQATLQAHALTWTAGAAVVVALLYVGIGSLRFRQGRLRASDHARAHLAVILACLALALTWGAVLDPAKVVAGFHGPVDQTALDARLPAAVFVAAVGVATAIASLIWGWRDHPNLLLGSWAALLLAMAACYTIVPGFERVSRSADETLLQRRRAGAERLAFGLVPIELGPPPALPSVGVPGLPLWDATRVAMIVGTPATAVTLSASLPGWLAVPLAPAGTAERYRGVVRPGRERIRRRVARHLARAPACGDTLAGLAAARRPRVGVARTRAHSHRDGRRSVAVAAGRRRPAGAARPIRGFRSAHAGPRRQHPLVGELGLCGERTLPARSRVAVARPAGALSARGTRRGRARRDR
jgi:hypothetical protein